MRFAGPPPLFGPVVPNPDDNAHRYRGHVQELPAIDGGGRERGHGARRLIREAPMKVHYQRPDDRGLCACGFPVYDDTFLDWPYKIPTSTNNAIEVTCGNCLSWMAARVSKAMRLKHDDTPGRA